MAAESVCVAIFLLSCRVAVMKWSVKHVDLITTVVDVDMARSSLRDHDHDHDLRRGRCHSGGGGRGRDGRRFRGRVSRRGGGAPDRRTVRHVAVVMIVCNGKEMVWPWPSTVPQWEYGHIFPGGGS